MKVSICVPVYGVEKYIERCARSLFEQTYKDIEFIFVDDYSPDNSISILSTLVEKYPDRKKHVKIIRHERNRGLAAARNTAIENASGDFIMHVDSDDYIDNDTIEKCVKQQALGDYDIVSFDFINHMKSYDSYFIQPDFKDSKDLTFNLLEGHASHKVIGLLIRTSLYLENNIRTIEGINMAEDFFVTPRLAYFANSVSNLHQFLYHYNCTNTQSYTYSFSRKKAEQQLTVNSKLYLFFKEKNDFYAQLLKIKYIKYVLGHLKDSLLANDVDYYKLSIQRLDKCDKSLFKHIKTRDKLPYYINNIYINKIFLKIGRFGMATYKKFKA